MELVETQAEITAYVPNCACCGTTGITANGTNTDEVHYGLAADPSLPFGALVFIPAGHGVLDNVRGFDRGFRVDDRGGGVTREAREKGILRLDLRVRDHWWAQRFGRKTITVYVRKP